MKAALKGSKFGANARLLKIKSQTWSKVSDIPTMTKFRTKAFMAVLKVRTELRFKPVETIGLLSFGWGDYFMASIDQA
jgi:hypothetical protein